MHFKKFNQLLFLHGLLILLSLFNLCYADALDIQVSRNKIALGETLTVSYTLNGNANPTTPDFSALEKDFRILSTNYGTAINMINGVTSTQTFWRLTLEPKKAGELIIPEISFGNAKSAARKLVVEEANSQVITDKQDTSAFVKAVISTTSPYVQSQVLYTFKIFYQSQLENPRIDMPQVKDATLVQLDDGNQSQTTINGKIFFVIEKNFAYFPQKPGKISIPPAHFQALAYDLDSSIMNGPFYLPATKTLSLATQAFTLNVQNIPDQFQGVTWLPAKDISLTDRWSVNQNQWEAGNPVTRTITVEAQGLRADQIPDLTIDKISGVIIYVDPPKRSNSVQNNTLIGTLEQRVTYIPNSSLAFTIPALKLNWWNSQTNKAAVAQLTSIMVQVKGKINNTTLAKPTAVASVVDTAKPTVKPEAKVKSYLSIWFWVALILFAVWLMTLWLFWNKRVSKNNILPKQDKPPVEKIIELSDEHFAQACKAGNTAIAQQFLLSWAKKHWLETPLNLEKLSESIGDENFKNALIDLEQVIYAKNVTQWNGHALLTAYQKVKRQKKQLKTKMVKTNKTDPLPPLNP